MNVSYCNKTEEVSCRVTVAFEMLSDKNAVKLRLAACVADVFFRLNYLTIVL